MEGAQSSLVVDVIIALDFEATCDDEGTIPLEDQEIIEFPVIAVDVRTREVLVEHRRYVRPERSVVTPFCTNLTGITSDVLEREGGTFAEVLQDVCSRLEAHPTIAEAIEHGRVVAVAHGPWDLCMQLPREASEKGITLPSYFRHHFDVKQLFAHHRRFRGPQFEGRHLGSPTLPNLCRALGCEAVGRLHCGLDDARSIVAICRKWLEDKALSEELFSSENLVDPEGSFLAALSAEEAGDDNERCVAIRLSGLPFVVHGCWLRQWLAGLLEGKSNVDTPPRGKSNEPSELWMLLNDRGRPTGQAVILWSDQRIALSALRKLRCGRELRIEGFEEDNTPVLFVRQVRAAPLRSSDLRGLVESVVPFPATPDHVDAVRFDGLVLQRGDWFCPVCSEMHTAEYRSCKLCDCKAPKAVLLELARTAGLTDKGRSID